MLTFSESRFLLLQNTVRANETRTDVTARQERDRIRAVRIWTVDAPYQAL